MDKKPSFLACFFRLSHGHPQDDLGRVDDNQVTNENQMAILTFMEGDRADPSGGLNA